jgi:Arc/MetJ family transcription regulator
MANSNPHSNGESLTDTDPLDAWITELATAPAIDRTQLLGVSRAAHGVTRAAAPFTMFLAEAAREAARIAQHLASVRSSRHGGLDDEVAEGSPSHRQEH